MQLYSFCTVASFYGRFLGCWRLYCPCIAFACPYVIPISLPGRAPAFIAGAPPLSGGFIVMVQSFLNVFTVFLNNYSNPIILLSCGIFAAEACVYLVKRMTFR